jgi:23S rRNA (uracil1939-C5)-methyltransferase
MRVKIEKLVYGGDGLARTDEGVVFVPRAAPGDIADVEVLERKKDYAVARLVAVLEPSEDRQTPVCPNYESAGCCHWQHIRYPRQLDFKETILRETLWRAGRIQWTDPIQRISGPDREDRMRATFHTRGNRLGFMRERSHEVVPIAECSALAPALNAFIPEANRMLAEDRDLAGAAEVRAVAGDNGAVAASFHFHEADPVLRQIGAEAPQSKVGGFTFALHPAAFFQSNRFLAGAFLEAFLAEAGESTELACDLYCGTGFFSIPLAARGRRVIGIDLSRIAIQLAGENARLNGVSNVEFIQEDLDDVTGTSRWRPQLLLLDPPRSGCGARSAERIAAWKAPLVVYVSCNPSTFAREAAIFLKAGYRLERITLIDQFPNTYHIETIARFALPARDGSFES